jgi:heme/copper-type cytochrome/quinol oxidase subunit 3
MVKAGGTPGEFHEIGDVGFPTALFLLSEIAFFGGAFVAYFYLRSAYAVWPPEGLHHLDVAIPSIQTGLLIVSSIMIEWSTAGVKKGNQTAVKFGFLGAVILGLGFVVIQMGYEWPNLLTTGELTPRDGLFGASFFLLTGIHGVHVIAGVIANSVVTIKAFRNQFDEKNHGFLEAAGTYWHFVHIVWLFLFAFLWQDGLSYFQAVA